LADIKERIENMLQIANLWPIDKLNLVLVFHYAERFENEVATNIGKAKRPNVVFKFGTFYLWILDKILTTLTGLAPTLIKNRIRNYLNKLPHKRTDDDGVTLQMEDIIPVISWLEKEGRAVQLDNHPIRDMTGANSSHTGLWTDPASSDHDVTSLPWIVFDDVMTIDMVRFDNILEKFLNVRYGTKTIPKEGLEFWRAFGSLDIEKFDIFSPQAPDGNLNSGVPAGEEGSMKEKSYDMNFFNLVELMFNYNTAGEDGGTADNGDRPVLIQDIRLYERMFGLDNEKVWFGPNLVINQAGTPTLTSYDSLGVDVVTGLKSIDDNTLHKLQTMIDNNRDNLKVIQANMGAQFKLVKDTYESVVLTEFIKNGLNGGSESPEKRTELAEFFKLESVVQSLLRQGTIGNADWLKHPFRKNWYIFEGLKHNNEGSDALSHDLLYAYDRNTPATPALVHDIFWHPKLYQSALAEEQIGSMNDKFFYLKSFAENYLSKIPKSLQFTMLYLIAKTGDFFIDPDNAGRISGSLNKDGLGTSPTAVVINTLLHIGAADGAPMSGLTQTGSPSAGSGDAFYGTHDLDIGTDDVINTDYVKGQYSYPILTLQVAIDAFNYRNSGTGNNDDSQETRRYRVARDAHNGQPAVNKAGGVGILTALSFENASWSVGLKSFVDEYRPVYYTKRTIAVQTGTQLVDTSQFEMLYSWYDRYAIKKLFPGLFAFGLPNVAVSGLRSCFEMLMRPAAWNSTSLTPTNVENWLKKVTDDEWLKDVEYISKVTPRLYEPLQDFISISDQV
jgi:hypothetical protein